MAVSTHVAYESRVRVRYGAIAFAAAVLIVGSQLIQLSVRHPAVDELTLDLIVANSHRTIDVVGAALDMLGLLAVGTTLAWLHAATRARRPGVRQFVRWLAIVGAVLSAVMALAYAWVVAIKAHEFVTTGTQSFPEADHLTTSGIVFVLPLLLELGWLLLALACIWVSLNAMRTGLLTRPVGYAGVVAGALFLFPLGELVPVVQGFWLAAIAVTLAARWPGGDPPAWRSGEAVPWAPLGNPGGQQAAGGRPRRGAMQRQPLFGFGRRPTPPPKQESPSQLPAPRAGTPKRKRKRHS